MRLIFPIIAAALAVVHASPLYDFAHDDVELPKDLPPGTRIMDAASIAESDFGDEEPIIFAPAPTHTLTPSIHHDHDTSSLDHLIPNNSKTLYFAQGSPHSKPFFDAAFLHADMTFKYPTVVLDHSCHAFGRISGRRMKIAFTDEAAFEIARSKWQFASAESPFILITTTGSKDGHFVYYLVTAVTCQDAKSRCVLGATPAEFNDLAEGFQLLMGQVDHPNAKRAPTETEEAETLEKRQSTPGSSFDERLDAALGYHVWSRQTFQTELQDFAPGVTDFNYDHYKDVNQDADGIYAADGSIKVGNNPYATYYDSGAPISNTRRSLQSRAASDPVAAGMRKMVGAMVADSDRSVLQVIGDFFRGLFQGVKSYVDGTVHSFQVSKTFSKPNATERTAANKYRETPWWKDDTGRVRTAREIYAAQKGNSQFNIYCVDCLVEANIQVVVQLGYVLGKGFQTGNVRIVGSVDAGLGIGIAAGFTQSKSESIRLFTVGAPGVSVPNILSVGPIITLDLLYGYELNVQGAFLVGGRTTFIGLDTVIDLVNPSNTRKPLTQPVFSPYFQANTLVNANAYAGLAAAISIGIDVANGQASAAVLLQSEPKFTAALVLGAQIGTANTGVQKCAGIATQFTLEHSTYAQAIFKAPLIGKKETEKYKLTNDAAFTIGQRCFFPSQKRQVDYPSDLIGNAALYSDLTEPNYTLTEIPPGASDPLPQFAQWDQKSYSWPAPIQAMMQGQTPNYVSSPDTPESDSTKTTFNYTIITDLALQYNLASTDNGNLALEPANSPLTGENLFETFRDVIVGDSFGRSLVYYHGEMQAYNVSRIRLVTSDKIPLTTGAITLVPVPARGSIPTGGNPLPDAPLIAADTSGKSFFLTLCNYADGVTPSKMFLVADPTTGPQKLANPALVNVLTGGAIQSCQIASLLDGSSG